MNILSWILLGLIAGIAANVLYPEPSRGSLVSAIGLGVIGAVVGGFLSSLFIGINMTGFNLSSLLIATIGALLLSIVGRGVRGI